MNIQEQFNLIAEEYDANRRKFIPCFDDFYISSTKFISESISVPEKILDLGSGTGLLAYYWYQQFPESEYSLIDIADNMLEIARKRFYGLNNFSYTISDYRSDFPEEHFDAVVSALSVHHLENGDKKTLFSDIYRHLNENGIFVNYDQFCGGSETMNGLYDSYWERHLLKSGLNSHDIMLWKERRRLDRECSVEDEIKMLKETGFKEVKCIYTYQKFSVILCIK